MSLYENRQRSSSDVKRLAKSHLVRIDQKIDEFQALSATLRDLVARCQGDGRPDYPIMNDLARSGTSRTMKGGGAAGVATMGAAGVEFAQNVLAETQTAILPLVPYLDTLRRVFIAVALGGIADTIYARLNDWQQRLR